MRKVIRPFKAKIKVYFNSIYPRNVLILVPFLLLNAVISYLNKQLNEVQISRPRKEHAPWFSTPNGVDATGNGPNIPMSTLKTPMITPMIKINESRYVSSHTCSENYFLHQIYGNSQFVHY